MADTRGTVTMTANGKQYRLWLGMSVLADLQSQHGDDVLARLDPPQGAGTNWLPPLRIIVDLFIGALQRHHKGEADRYLVDDLLAENADAFGALMAAAFPDQQQGNAKRPKRAA